MADLNEKGSISKQGNFKGKNEYAALKLLG